jgi:dihydropyrimidine dehydrogenase (NAD+) subunit PreA
MCERGMGSAVGQNPEVAETIVGWVMEAATIPVIVKPFFYFQLPSVETV